MKPLWRAVVLVAVMLLVSCQQAGDADDSDFFSDTFDEPSGWRTSSDPEVEIAYVDGALSIEIMVLDRVAWSVAGRSFKDGAVSVDATPVGGPDDNAYGLVIRHRDDRNFYRFEVSSDGFFAVQAPKGAMGWEYLVDWTESAAIHQGRQTNHLKVDCRGSTMVFFVNDVQLAQVDDGRFSKGDIGVIAGTFYVDPGTHIQFDNFAVEPVGD